MGIVLTAIGEVDLATLEILKNGLSKTFKENVFISEEMPDPEANFPEMRGEWSQVCILAGQSFCRKATSVLFHNEEVV